MRGYFLVCLFAVLLPPSNGRAQTVSGLVTEQASGVPVRGVGVVLTDSLGRVRMGALSDSLGHFRMTAASSGLYYLTFRRSGMNPLEGVKTTLRSGYNTVVDVALSRGITTLATVNVRAERVLNAPSGNRHKYEEFGRRRALGLGHFLTREDLDSRPRHQMQEVFNGIPGIKVRHNGTQWTLQSQRCSGKSIPGLDPRENKRKPLIFIDGVLAADGEDSALSHLTPSEVEAVEVYQGAAQMPFEARGNACFAIFVWLRG